MRGHGASPAPAAKEGVVGCGLVVVGGTGAGVDKGSLAGEAMM